MGNTYRILTEWFNRVGKSTLHFIQNYCIYKKYQTSIILFYKYLYKIRASSTKWITNYCCISEISMEIFILCASHKLKIIYHSIFIRKLTNDREKDAHPHLRGNIHMIIRYIVYITFIKNYHEILFNFTLINKKNHSRKCAIREVCQRNRWEEESAAKNSSRHAIAILIGAILLLSMHLLKSQK